MYEYYPLLIVGAVIGLISVIFICAFFSIKDRKEAIGFDRNMKDGEIIKRLLKYAKPHYKSFIAVFVIMLFSISYDIISPTLVGNIEEMIKEDFELKKLYVYVIIYASILLVSLVSTYVQAILLQKTGQKILSQLREDTFTHIESLSHNQLHSMPVGKLLTRVTNDTNAISMLFTNILVNLFKNVFIIFGVVAAMLMLNYGLTLMVLCFAPFIALFTVIFRKFSRKAYREVNDGTTDINTFLSENLSGM
ncbi:MAG: ABC transporter ATP-binding protein, partial [Clostridia bacterium]|nr:ABC transporter ATP-binding protein [Clostridia bacterium]